MVTCMIEIFKIIAHLLSTLVRAAGPGGVRAVIAESLLLKHQLLVLSRSRNRAPRLTPWDRLVFGIGAFLVARNRLAKIAIGIKPATLLRFHRALVQRKYRLLFTPRARGRPGPKGPSKELIAAILEMKHRNPRFGCPRIAQQMAHAFGVEIDKDVVRRILDTLLGLRTCPARIRNALRRLRASARSRYRVCCTDSANPPAGARVGYRPADVVGR